MSCYVSDEIVSGINSQHNGYSSARRLTLALLRAVPLSSTSHMTNYLHWLLKPGKTQQVGGELEGQVIGSGTYQS